MDVRWLAYIGSGLLATASLVPMTWYRDSPPVVGASRAPSAAARPAASRNPRDDYARLMEVERRVASLRQYQVSAPEPLRASRNPFRFGAAPVRVASAAPASLPEPAADVPPPVSVSQPPLRLVGVVERRKDDTVEYTAVVSAFHNVHLLVAGARLGDWYTVETVTADGVELRDTRSGETLRLAMTHQP